MAFFATSHGNSPCDGTGGTVKGLVKLEILRRPRDKQILNCDEMLSWVSNNIENKVFLCNIY